jgi:hypothetical protein
LIAAVDQGAMKLLEATLLGQGYYRSCRHWRGPRRVRALTHSR